MRKEGMISICENGTPHAKNLLPDDGVEGLVRANGLEEDDDGDSSRVELTIAMMEG